MDGFSHKIKSLISLMRVHQWVKNVFIFAPLFFTPADVNAETIFICLLGFFVFCFTSSAVYIMNDFMDRHSDKNHPIKCKRPLASGAVTTREALMTFILLLILSFSLSSFLPFDFFIIVLTYLAINICYSTFLKSISIVDILCIAIGFQLRVVAGASLIYVTPSVWIMVCTAMLALFLAVAKRRDDLVTHIDSTHRKSLKGYTIPFIDTCMIIVLSTLLVSYTIYTTTTSAMLRMHSQHLYLTVPFVLMGILRYLQIVMVEERSGSPTKILYSDRFISVTILLWIATFAILIYF